ncbi:hypothetical protein [Sphaerisporangium sp. TRM90804]|uniref:hypothetical protein n=1 Tax=Sphaerisporangium sp. TRM90804 TaxID=3031113 RepID=UPI00244A991A|nr:hypothetical protein [Sphaerisporangium sp. TRM90804]MDH2430414.1 hypothetical protein [Sphaerisporangium sp. TRM90804]
MSVQTYTYTWTQTRLESIQDQFRFLLTYGDIAEAYIDQVVQGVSLKAVESIGLFGCDHTGLRVIEVELRVDWSLHAQLTLSMPSITGGLSGWDGRQAPEVKVAGRRFAETAKRMRLDTNYWVQFTAAINNDAVVYKQWLAYMNLGGGAPAWKHAPQERSETFLDLGEANVFMRRAGHG